MAAHYVLGHLATLHGGHRRQRELSGQIAGGEDVGHVGLAVSVDRDVPTPRCSPPLPPPGPGPPSSAPTRWPRRACVPCTTRPSSHRTTTPLLTLVHPDGPGALQEVDSTPGEVCLQYRRHLRVLVGEDLLAAHDEGHLAAERGEHMDELHAGDPRPDDHQVVRQDLGGIGVAGGQQAVNQPTAQGGMRGRLPVLSSTEVGLEGQRSLGRVRHDGVGVDQAARGRNHRHPLASQDLLVGLLEVLDDTR